MSLRTDIARLRVSLRDIGRRRAAVCPHCGDGSDFRVYFAIDAFEAAEPKYGRPKVARYLGHYRCMTCGGPRDRPDHDAPRIWRELFECL